MEKKMLNFLCALVSILLMAFFSLADQEKESNSMKQAEGSSVKQAENSGVPSNVAPDHALRAQQRALLVEMIDLNRKIRLLRDQAIKQDENTRRQWAEGLITEEQLEEIVAKNNTNLPPMQKRWKELETEFNNLQKQIIEMNKETEINKGKN